MSGEKLVEEDVEVDMDMTIMDEFDYDGESVRKIMKKSENLVTKIKYSIN